MAQQVSAGGYVRHRDRMVQESIFEDLQNTLIACRWMSGTTSRPVVSPDDPAAGWQIITTAPADVLRLLDGHEVKLIDYFPEANRNDDGENPEGQQRSRKTDPNTLAVDTGVAQAPQDLEMGSNFIEQPYLFTMAFYASSDAVALALMNDLRDRYQGRIVSDDHLNLYNYNAPGFDSTTLPVTRMECVAFRYEQNVETVAPWEAHLYYAELTISDYVDPQEVRAIPLPMPSFGGGVMTGVGAPVENGQDGIEYVDLTTGDVYEWED